MNKIFNINLGGYPFTIDDNAYNHLMNYLDTIQGHFNNSESCEEIMGDIEFRMAELFQEGMQSRPIVTRKDVDDAIKIMGTPEDFGAESYEDDDYQTNVPIAEKITKSGKKYRVGKRLFRHTEDKVLSGVCSGISEYLGIADPIWVRLTFILLTVAGGLALPAYLVLWAIVPAAKTSSDILAMKGEQINISNMARVIEEEIETLGDKLDLNSKTTAQSKKKVLVKEISLEMPLRKGFLY